MVLHEAGSRAVADDLAARQNHSDIWQPLGPLTADSNRRRLLDQPPTCGCRALASTPRLLGKIERQVERRTAQRSSHGDDEVAERDLPRQSEATPAYSGSGTTPRTVWMYFPAGPSFLRKLTICTSTARSVTA